LQEQAIDMVLTDYCMPEMNGYDLLKAIKVHLTCLPSLCSDL
jgi:CheY-like chemotaxis protein